MIQKPANLIYGVNDKPPLSTTIFLGLQHVFVIFIAMIFPVMIVNHLGTSIDPRTASGFISITMISSGIVTIIQALKKGPVGSGYLCPSVCGPSYLQASFMAMASGGFPVLFGMTGFVGVVESIFSKFMHKLRVLFPAEVTGTIVAMVGITIIPISIKSFVGLSDTDTIITSSEVIVGISVLLLMIGLNVFGKGKLRLYSCLIGMVSGYVLAYIFGLFTVADFQKIMHSKVIDAPYLKHISWAFDPKLLIPFIIAALCSALKTVGDLTTCQKINDANWKRPEMKSISKGILADGLGGIIPGIFGGFGQSTSSTNVGLSIATGATSRTIAFSAGGILIFLGFFPKLANIFIIMPKPVMGATLIYAISFMIISGFQIIMSRMLDSRKIFVVGVALIFGLSADMVPLAYVNIHSWLKPIFHSSLSLGAVTAVVLNLLMRIGVKKKLKLMLTAGQKSSDKIFNFMQKAGGSWGARPNIIFKAITVMNEFMESTPDLALASQDIVMQVSFDEFNLDVTIEYRGKKLVFPEKKPSKESLMTQESAAIELASYLIKQNADAISSKTEKNKIILTIHFEH
ncbi:MAG: solute carrier family 23 protein [Candidatus Celaenobacter antarcticus]|nr:solute carrier family 23 protein [Candidatus Celaenobacter antarcticus]